MSGIDDASAVAGFDSAVEWEDARDANRELWEDRAVLHEGLYDSHALAGDTDALSTVIRDDLPVLMQHLRGRMVPADDAHGFGAPLADLDLLHLQCHIGTDTLSLARLGARVTGLDFSAAALDVARRLADEAGLEIAWVESDVLNAREAVAGDFDVVYTSIGTIIWLNDLATWAGQIAVLLRAGGVFYIRDGHPALLALDERIGTPTVGYRYFANGRAQTWDDGSTYAGEGTTAHTRSYEWPHSLSEIIGSLLAAGLVLERFDEGRTLPWQFSELMTPIDGSWEFGPEWRDKIPCTFTIAARRPLDAARERYGS
ncbi:class I SAM-dependent methyltransferase [Microbacterium panaciterrae]|uniref:Class I SAM-dependent methyltransferase n=1 Tax=Microbacterium panaciterrae TaxID=985759 RepID=A0ABP8P574_9MICO